MARLIRWLAALLFAAIVLGLPAASWYCWQILNTRVAPPNGSVVVTVHPRSTFQSITVQLHRAGVLRKPELLQLWARYSGVDRRVRSGEYRIASPVSPLELLDVLQSPSHALRWVTIPEGLTASQVVDLFVQNGFGGRDVFAFVLSDPVLLRTYELPAAGVEGFLFPDTYAFEWSMEPDAVIGAMLKRYRQQSAALEQRRIAAGLSELEMVTLASVIEKETGQADERPLISGVFHNRLRLGIPLQSDPTVLYGRGNGRSPLTRTDLTSLQPYNTYVHKGLPPGPIANPGRAALEAAVAPAHTAALYFVSRNDGSHSFSETLDEHNRAVRRFQPNRD